ncbi:hypothetical protein [Methylophaga sulfidovorans]|nr:hypothetical protein [Methylophaga sulfidovorans]
MYPFRAQAIRVDQPLGSFFMVSIPARVLLDTCHSVRAELLNDGRQDEQLDSFGKLKDFIKGTERT